MGTENLVPHSLLSSLNISGDTICYTLYTVLNLLQLQLVRLIGQYIVILWFCQVRGLCGDMDGSISNEFTSRNGIEEQLVAFFMSYSDCVGQTPLNYVNPDPCAYDISVSVISVGLKVWRRTLWPCDRRLHDLRPCQVSLVWLITK